MRTDKTFGSPPGEQTEQLRRTRSVVPVEPTADPATQPLEQPIPPQGRRSPPAAVTTASPDLPTQPLTRQAPTTDRRSPPAAAATASPDLPTQPLARRAPTAERRGRHASPTSYTGPPLTAAPGRDRGGAASRPDTERDVDSATVAVAVTAPPTETVAVTAPPTETEPHQGPADGRKPGRPSVVRSALLTAASQAVLPLTALATGPILARVLGPHDRGLMSAVLAPMFVAMFVAAFAIPEASTYAVAKLGVSPRRAFLAGTPMLLSAGIVASVSLWVAAPVLMGGTPEAIGVLRMVVPCLPLMMFTLLQRFAVSGAGRFVAVATERTTAALGRAIPLVVLAITGMLTAFTAVWVNLGSTILAALILTVPLLREPARNPESGPVLAFSALSRKMSVYALRGWGGVCANLVNWRLDQAIMPALIGATPLGYYAVAVSLAELPSTLIGATKSVIFTEASARDDLRLAARAARVVIVASLVVDGLLALAAPLVVRILFGQAFAPSAPLAQLLLVGNVPFTAEVILASGLLAAGHPGLRSIGQVIAAGLTVSGIFLLVPGLGATGAALTSVVTYTLSFTMTVGFFCRSTGIPVRDCLILRRSDISWLRGKVSGIRSKHH